MLAGSEPLLSRQFVLVSLVNASHTMAFALFVHFPGFLEQLGATEVAIGLIVGFSALAAIVVRPWVGGIMDARGRRSLILVGNVTNVVAIGLYLLIDRIDGWIFLLRMGHGLSEAILFTTLLTFAADYVPASRRTQGLALFGASGLVPIALAGLLGDFILQRWSFDALFMVSAGFALLSLLLSLPLQDTPTLAALPAARAFLAAIAHGRLFPIWWITFMFSLVLTAYFVFLRTFVDETGIGSVGVFFAFYAGTAILLRLFFGWVPDRVGVKRALTPAMLSLAGGLVVLALTTSGGGVALAGMLCGVGHGYAFPILYALTIDRSLAGERGAAMAAFTGLFDVGTLVGGPVLGTLIRWASYRAMFLGAAGFVVVGMVLFTVWDRSIVPARPWQPPEGPVPP